MGRSILKYMACMQLHSFSQLHWSMLPLPCIQLHEAILILIVVLLGEQEWRSGESTCLPPLWPGFDSLTRRHMWVEFVVGSRPCSRGFFSGFSGFPPSTKTNTNFQFDPRMRATGLSALLLSVTNTK